MTDPTLILGLAYVGKKSADVAAEFVRDFLGPSIKAAGEGIAAPIEAWKHARAERATALLSEAAKLLEEAGLSAQPVPGRVLWPILEKGSLEEDSGLHSMWVRLLANASKTGNQKIGGVASFPHILAELTPTEAAILQSMYDEAPAAFGEEHPGFHVYSTLALVTAIGINPDDFAVILDNLVRLQLLHRSEPVLTEEQTRQRLGEILAALEPDEEPHGFDDIDHPSGLMLTDLGREFIRHSVRPPEKASPPLTGALEGALSGT